MAPVVQAPVVQAPVVQAPVVQAPVVQAPVVQAPVVQAPSLGGKPGPLKPDRLKRRAEFLAVAGKGRKAPVPGLVLQALRRDDALPVRLGFTVTKKVGNAVRRNRTRRRLREAARAVLAEFNLAGVDLVLIGRDGTSGRPFEALKDDFRRALERVGV